MKKIYFLLILGCLSFLTGHVFAQSTTFVFNGTAGVGASGINGTPQTFAVPLGNPTITIDIYGGAGGFPCCDWSAGSPGTVANGGRVQCTMNVTTATTPTLYVYVGGAGGSNYDAIGQSPGGWNGGAIGGSTVEAFCAGGGGETDIRTSTTAAYSSSVLVVAGAGGGGGDFGPVGGLGGGITGGTGAIYSTGPAACGGGQTGPSCASGSAVGTQGNGGQSLAYSDGGGGAGWWGGNCGNSDNAGGGGSSYPAAAGGAITAIVHTQGYSAATGNGHAMLTIPATPWAYSNLPSLNFGLVAIGSCATLSISFYGINLTTGPITVTAPSGYQVSLSPTSGFGTTATLAYSGVSLATTIVYVQFCPTGSATYSGNLVLTGGGLPTASSVPITGIGVAPCSGTPTPGTTTASTTTATSTTSVTLSLTGATVAGGLTYQWQSSSTLTGVYTNIYGATNSTYTFTGLYANTYFQCVIGCSFAGVTANSTPTEVTLSGTGVAPAAAVVTAIPSPLAFGSVTVSTSSVPVQYFALSGTNLSVSPLTITPPANFAVSTNGITWVTSPSTLTVPYTPGYPTGSLATENIYVQFNPGATVGAAYSGNIAITGGDVSATVNVAVSGTGAAACSGTPTAGTANINPSLAGVSTPVSLSLTGTSAVGGLTYQWQSGTSATGPWTNITGAIASSDTVLNPSASITYYQCIVTCPLGGSAATSSVISTTAAPSNALFASSCTPSFVEPECCDFQVAVSGYPFYCPGDAGTSITDATANASGSTYYINQTAVDSCKMSPGSSYTMNVGYAENPNSCQIWIDFNNDGTFQTSESVGGTNYAAGTVGYPTITLPITGISSGSRRMRVEVNYNLGDAPYYPAYPNLIPCPSSSADVYYGEVRDYTVKIGPGAPPPCASIPNAGFISPSMVSGCTTFSPILFNVGEPISYTGLKYQWQSSSSVIGPWTSISGATGVGYAASPISSVGTVYYRDSITCTNGTVAAQTPAQAITLNAPPTIAGTEVVCPTLTTTLNGTPSGGTWSSASTNIAIGSATGIVTGVNPASTATVTYTAPTTCSNTAIVTVNPNPVTPLSSPSSVCQSSTASLTDASGSGTWSSGNTALATVSGSTLTGVAAGTPTVTFTLGSTGCYSTTSVTVNAAATIAGTPSACLGFTSTLSASISGGTWSSSNTGVATVNSSGVVYAVTLGSTTISYITPITGCIATQAFNVITPPSIFAVTGGGSFCSGAPTIYVGLDGSGIGVPYTLVNTLTGPVGSPVTPTTGLPFVFGAEPAGSYYVVAASGTACSAVMTGTVTVTALPLPTAYSVSGGGSYCPSGSGVSVYLSNSAIGINYQLFVGAIPVGLPVAGTGLPLTFGLETTAGVYTIVATNTSTGCVNTMAGSATVSIYTPPATTPVVGGGGPYCSGGTGNTITLSTSTSGVNYQLYLSGVPVGSVVGGTGSGLTFGPIATGGVYNIVGTSTSTGCSSTMSGTATITPVALPTVYTVTGGGGYCASTTAGVPVGLNGSTVGVNYQLWVTPTTGGVTGTTTMVGSAVPGTGSAITFTSGTGAGGTYILTGATTGASYSVVATLATTPFCSSNMFGSVSVYTNLLPNSSFSVTGGGNYCAGTSGVPVYLSGSVSGTTYSLYDGLTLVSAASGTGSSITFGYFTSTGTYTVIGSTAYAGAATCTATMSGSVVVNVTPLPNVYTLSAGASSSYCSGTSPTGASVALSGSTTGINYNLYQGGLLTTTVAGTGSPISFPNVVAGSYTVVASTTTTPVCTSNMTGSVAITANALPTLYSVTGGGNYCAGATIAGAHVGLSSTNTGINYTLVKVGTGIITSMPGIGGSIDFGVQPAGTYKIAASNTSTGCSDTMSGTAVVTINALPTSTYTVTDPLGAQYCFGSTGVTIGTSSSDAGINYQLASGGGPIGSPVAGVAGTALSFGLQTGSGPYTVIATNAATGCSATLAGSIAVTINPVPAVEDITGGGPYCGGPLGTSGALVGLGASTLGISYQLFNGSASVGPVVPGTGSPLNFGAETGGTYTVVATNPATGCFSDMSGSAVVTLNPAPASTYIVSGGGAYCTGGTGVAITLSSSSPGIYYQLISGSSPVGSPVAGTGLGLTYSSITASGSYTVIGTNAVTGCEATMTGAAVVSVSSLPTAHNVTGSGNYCPGGTGVPIGLDGSNTGTTYQLYNGSTPVPGGMVTGTGLPVSFGMETATGTYTVIGNNGCTGSMTGSATIGLYSLPVAYDITGGGNYCPGGTGVSIGLSGSATGLSYTLQDGAGPVTTLTGTGFSLNFGPQTASGTYTIIASNPPATGSCTSTMAGTAAVVINTPPTAFNVTGGGNYCAAGSGVLVGLDNSVPGTEYQLYNGIGMVGSPVHGTGSAISFGLQTAAGTYTVVATSLSTTCTNNMSGSAVVSIIPLPSVETVTASGSNYCAGSGGIDIMLGSSQAGVNYQLFNGTTAVPGALIAGSGAGLDFGFQTAGGTYTIVGTQGSCSNTMSGAPVIVVDPLPTAYTVGGGGNYCAGGTGVHVTLSGSNTGISYQLMNGIFPAAGSSPMPGTGSALDFGLQTAAGSYTVMATNTASTCANTMAGTVVITINAVPNIYTVTSSASNYCAGSDGVDLQLSGSDAGILYQLYNGSTTLGSPVPGTGFDIDFGLQTLAGAYSVVAINPGTTCNSNMGGGATIVINPLPTAYTVVGGGNYCSGGTGVYVGLSSSNTGISYQLYIGGGIPVGSPKSGTGLSLDFGAQTTSGTYTVVATNVGTTCTQGMAGSAIVTITALPSANTVTGGGPYCAGADGVHIGLDGSTGGVNYQLYNGSALVGTPVAGTGIAIDFGLQTAAGTYTVMALNSTTSCASSMTGSATVTINSLPSAFAVVGGGNYCPGGDGVTVGLSGSATGISYQLFNGTAPAGSAMLGTGSARDFGMETAAGTYSVVASNSSTGCTSNMSGTATIGLNTLPGVYSVLGGGNYCAGGAGAHVGLTGSATGINYQLFNSAGAAGFPVAGTGGPLDFGAQTVAGIYTVVATNGTTGCSNNMSGSTSITIVPTVSPSVNLATGIGDTTCEGRSVTLSTTVANGGSSPMFSWTINGSPVSGAGTSYSYIPSNGDVIGVTMTSNATCATPATVSNSVTLDVWPTGEPTISIAASPASAVCQGTVVTFNNSNTYGGTPTFSWIVNASNVSSAASYSYTPANGDVVYAIMNSNYLCRLEDAVTSNHITMEVDDSLIPVVTITAIPGTNISAGENVTFTASVVNGGATPSYQWFVNGAPVPGANAASYTGGNFVTGDSVTCEVTASGGCTGLSSFNSVRIVVGTTGVNQIATNNSNIQLIPNPNNGNFTIKGTLGTTADEEVSVEISDMLGQVIYKDKVMAHGGNIDQKIQLSSSIANGMYLLNLSSGSENDVFHVVIEQ